MKSALSAKITRSGFASRVLHKNSGARSQKCNGELKIYGRWLEHARDTNRWDLPYNFEDGPLQKKIHFEFSTERWEFSKLGMPKKALFRMACDNLIY